MTARGILHPGWLRPALMLGVVTVHGALIWALSPKTRAHVGLAPPVIEMVQAQAEASAPAQPPETEAAPSAEQAPAVEQVAAAEPAPAELPPPVVPPSVEPLVEAPVDRPELPPEPVPPPVVAEPSAPVIPAVQPQPERPRDAQAERRIEQRRIERERAAEAQRREREDERRRKREEQRQQAMARPPRELSTGTAASEGSRPAQAGGNVSAAAYASQVHRILQTRTSALGLNARGNVSVSFAIDASGRMAASGIIRSSGDDGVDHAIRTMLARSSFPAPPAGRFSGSVTIRIQ
ncbi:TonB family protein [Phreatobacter stygius]|uniref:TonB C-terminal domain-containing protein n=1 Tax=Phreatobacter stygius TaxID=1940610 RepID=A0A4D7BA73_9HYPH|nr:TonB family protein [Phreatobacter stygius]QCI67048.1 TonB C-terminal domain-containing protein [Phreatobacter stygius]